MKILVPTYAFTLTLSVLAVTASASPIRFGPDPYLQTGDSPAGFATSLIIEDFEDQSLDPFLTIAPGTIVGPDIFPPDDPGHTADSVDGDDGSVDGSGSRGWSWFTGSVSSTMITFDDPVTSAGVVVTDGPATAGTITVEALDGLLNPLDTWTVNSFLDNVFTGETPEDRFMGFRDDMTPIKALRISVGNGKGIEVDHIQWQPVPEPASLVLTLLGALSLLVLRRI